jgi:hypothetical protein
MYEAIDYLFIESRVFQKEWTKLGYSEEDYEKLTDYLTDNPGIGNMISGTGGVMKLRWPASGYRGKRGGSRVIYFAKNRQRMVYFIMVYSKNNQLDLTEAQKRTLRTLVKQI